MADSPPSAALPDPSCHTIALCINRKNHRIEVESWVSLLDLLRDRQQLQAQTLLVHLFHFTPKKRPWFRQKPRRILEGRHRFSPTANPYNLRFHLSELAGSYMA